MVVPPASIHLEATSHQSYTGYLNYNNMRVNIKIGRFESILFKDLKTGITLNEYHYDIRYTYPEKLIKLQ